MFGWLRRVSGPVASPAPPLQTIRQYVLTRKLGEGGMGVVYEARDERLGRLVAIKRVRTFSGDATLRDRLVREARTAAGISHPNICQVYELGEEGEELFVVMELLDGETLAARVARGPIPVGEALQITLGILGALEAMHLRGIVHRDLKPSNVFLTPHGVKLLDFGLARPPALEAGELAVTNPGTVLGTPRYMAPEMLSDEPIGPPTDVFGLGAILFEMLTGRPAFGGSTLPAVYNAVLSEQPPPLVGEADVIAADRVIQRALAKRPSDRWQDAAAMAQAVRDAMALVDTGPARQVRTVTRLIVLPFRVLRPDPEIDFLASGLPEAISSSLSGLETLTVRSTAAAARFGDGAPDFRLLATEAGVDVALLGTLLRAGGQVRVSIQLVEAPAGTVLISRVAQVALTDIFQLQDDLTREIVDALALPLSARDRAALRHDVPASAEAYELYLRATTLGESTNPSRLIAARDLYRRCVELDPGYAPAWARLGRVHRVMAKYQAGDAGENIAAAETAFRRALELNPDLPLAHNLYTYFEIEEFAGARSAMLRLLGLTRHGTADPDLYGGLVVACRFCGLLDASLEADRRARRIDPGVRTSVHYTYWMLGRYDQALLTDLEDIQILRHMSLWMLGRQDEALEGVTRLEEQLPTSGEWVFLTALRAAMQGRRDECVHASRRVLENGFHDPEGLYLAARELAFVGAHPEALAMLERVVEGGFHCPRPMLQDPWLDSLRGDPTFVRLLHRAEEESAASAAAFREAGGERVLGGSR
jgi:serine/threonine protein kinase/tetratricopeptide (TPR) repeat protein